jgi:hypothetical protein
LRFVGYFHDGKVDLIVLYKLKSADNLQLENISKTTTDFASNNILLLWYQNCIVDARNLQMHFVFFINWTGL